jgi:hypothetical protein
MFYGVSSVSTSHVEGPAHHGSVFINEEVDGVRDKVRTYHNSQCTDTLAGHFGGLPELGLYSKC